jgi:hypothetical protein
MLVVIAIVLAIMIVLVYQTKQNTNTIRELKLRVYTYSGLSPEVYSDFLNNINIAEQTSTYSVDLSEMYLDKAINALQELALYGDGTAIDDVHELASAIGDEVEKNIAQTAIKQGVRFRPKYTKDYDVYN